jgi:DNA processing protein
MPRPPSLGRTRECSLLSLLDDDYPQALAETAAPPPLLFARGQRALLQRPMLAMVGSRSATPPGKQIAEDFARQLSAHGYTIVSGLASGIDAAAHRGALQETGSTIAVIGTGIDRVYPASNRELAHQIGRSGLILSEFPLGAGPVAGHFPRRNRIIAGLVARLPGGGSQYQFRLADYRQAGRRMRTRSHGGSRFDSQPASARLSPLAA